MISVSGDSWAPLRHRTFELLEVARPGDRTSRATDVFIITLIILNVGAEILGTIDAVRLAYAPLLDAFEYLSVAIFTVEYVLRLWSAVERDPQDSRLRPRLRYAISWPAIIDLLAILPAFLPMLLPVDLRVLRLLRLFRMARLLKIGRYSRAVRVFGQVVHKKREELTIALLTVVVLLVISSSLMYFVEHDAQPTAFPDIPSAMWWAASALTTVGYGDVVPITAGGKLLGVVTSVLGIGLFALPAGIMASGFSEAFAREQRSDGECPTCGRPHHVEAE